MIRRNTMRSKTTPAKRSPGRPRLPDREQLKVRIPRVLAREVREYQEIRQELRDLLGKTLFSLNDVYTAALTYWWRKRGERQVERFRRRIADMRAKQSGE